MNLNDMISSVVGRVQSGWVYLVGAGPGDPGAITWRGIECLLGADVVLYDYLVNPAILRWAKKPGVRLISLGGHARQQRIMPQEEVSSELVKFARQGQVVVRLKSGDPIVFARAAEEIRAMQAAGVSFEVVPGVTSALAAGSFAGIPLTHRDHASAIALVTGHPASLPSRESLSTAAQPASVPGQQNSEVVSSATAVGLDWRALAAFPGTLVVYMGTTQVEYWAGELLRYGKPAATPVAVVRRCGFYDQSVQVTELGELVRVVTEPKRIRPPVLFVVGTAVTAAETSEWFTDRPLFGQSVMVTRPAGQSDDLMRRLELLGAQTYHWPAINIEPVQDQPDLEAIWADVSQFDWIVFSSRNGVEAFLRGLWERGFDWRALHRCRLAAIGAQTERALAAASLKCDLVPEQFVAEELAEVLRPHVGGAHCLLVRANRGRDVLRERLEEAGARVTQAVFYRHVDAPGPDDSIKMAMDQGRVSWVTVTSSAIAESLVRCYGESLRQVRLASISPVTSSRIRELGFDVSAEASDYTAEGVVQAILTAVAADD
jgi:uroporphyrinogen III methyltransferase/synthase